jgi:hypothetical protein
MIPGWSGTAGVTLAALVTLGLESPIPGSVVLVDVPLPARWQRAAHVVLVLEDVTTPRGQPFIVRLRATASGEPDVVLGSFGVLADQPGATGVRPPATYKVDVTRGLRRWGDRHAAAETVNIALRTVDGRSKPVVVAWRVGRAHLEIR